MYHRLFLVPALLLGCTGESLAHGPPENIFAFEGGDVILPCSFNITASSDFPTVEWSKEDLKPNIVFLYRDGCETYEMKDRAFEYRTSLLPKELKNGNISLRISNVQLSDAGRYQCMTLWSNGPRDVTTVELVVGSVFEPKLSVVSVDWGGLTLQCEANYSLPEPEITFVDDQGNKIPAEDPKRDEDAGGSYTIRRRMTLHSATNRVTCRVHQPKFNLVRHTEIRVSADFRKSCFLTAIITVGVTILVSALVCVVAVSIWRRRCKPGRSLLETDSVNNQPDQLQREVERLKLEANCNLKDKVTPQLGPVCQHRHPDTSKCPTQSHRNLKTTISTHRNCPNSTSLPKNDGPKPDIQKDNDDQAPSQELLSCTFRSMINNKSMKLSSFSEKGPLSHVCFSLRESCANPSNTSSQTSLSDSIITQRY
ncbi:hypothetical protein Q8A73_012735 [Channa argus]|nr:hypothetical protein Q8A73_012735 [Channa argus]